MAFATLLPINHWLFQCANFFLFLSYIATGLIQLRLTIMCASLFFMLWGLLILNTSLDTVLWNLGFFVCNAYMVTRLIYSRRPIAFDQAYHEEIYTRLFRSVGVSRLNFRELVNQGLHRRLTSGSTVYEEGNEAHNLTLLLKGVVRIERRGQPINFVAPYEFLESPEWASRSSAAAVAWSYTHATESFAVHTPHAAEDAPESGSDDLETAEADMASNKIGVSMRADGDIEFLVWRFEVIDKFFANVPATKDPVNTVVASDVARRLFRQSQVTERIVHGQATAARERPLQLDVSAIDSGAHTGPSSSVLDRLTAVGLAPEHAARFMDLGKVRSLRHAGALLTQQNEDAHSLALLVTGSLGVYREDEHSGLRRLDSIECGAFVAADAFLRAHATYSTTVLADEPSLVVVWDETVLHAGLTDAPELRAAVYKVLSEDIGRRMAHLMAADPADIGMDAYSSSESYEEESHRVPYAVRGAWWSRA